MGVGGAGVNGGYMVMGGALYLQVTRMDSQTERHIRC